MYIIYFYLKHLGVWACLWEGRCICSPVFMLMCVCMCINMECTLFLCKHSPCPLFPPLALSLLFIDRRSEFISHCDSFLPGPEGKRISVEIKSSDSAKVHNTHCVLISGQTLNQVECCPGIFYMRVHECVCRQWHIVIPLLIDAHSLRVRTFGKFWVHGQNNSEGEEMDGEERWKCIPANTNKRATLGGRPWPFGILGFECHVLRKLKD